METLPMPGAPGYSVTSTGVIYSDNYRNTGKRGALRNNVKGGGYVTVTIPALGKHGKCVHRLVALAFIPNPLNLPEVDHINGIRTDNRVENLRWITHKANIRAAMERRGNWLATAKKRAKPVEAFVTGLSCVRYESIDDACNKLGKPYTTGASVICRAIAKDWKAYGTHWRRVTVT